MLKPEDAGWTFEEMLVKAGFNINQPDLKTAWHVFKEFIGRKVDCAEDVCYFECGAIEDADKNLFYWDLVRQFDIEDAGDYDHSEQLHLEAQFKPDSALQYSEQSIWSSDYDSLAEFIRQLESLPEFKTPLENYTPIKVEIYQEEI